MPLDIHRRGWPAARGRHGRQGRDSQELCSTSSSPSRLCYYYLLVDIGDMLCIWYLLLVISWVNDICYLSCWSFLIVHLLPFLLKLISIGHTVVLKSNIMLGSSDVIKLSNSENRLRIKSWGNSTWTSSLTLAPSILSPLTTTCNSWVFWLIDWKKKRKDAWLF